MDGGPLAQSSAGGAEPRLALRPQDAWAHLPGRAGLALIVLGYEIVTNTAENLRKQNLASGFGFLGKTASFDISQTLIEYRSTRATAARSSSGF